MRLSVLAALGITAFLGIMTINPPDANAQTRRTTVVSSPRSAVIVSRPRGMRTAVVRPRGAVIMGRPRSTVIVSRPRGVRTAVVSPRGARGAVIMGRPRGAVVVSRRRNITRF